MQHRLNVRISQFGADFVQNLRGHMGGDPRVPDLRMYWESDVRFLDQFTAGTFRS